ncbi:hypothetical protein F5B19DRAFT_499864 [Rostrohypoxylon terebratum]|nr:hypothetical protein F5B19DRAFT_499864 [Rostrohypoxylon terebratum]
MADKKERMLSFGVELEFYIWWRLRDEESTARRPKYFELHPGGPLIVDNNSTVELCNQLQRRIRELSGISTKATVLSGYSKKERPTRFDEQWGHLSEYGQWSVKDEISLFSVPHSLEVAGEGVPGGWAPVEVVSPALWSTAEGFDQVRRVCHYLQNTYFIWPHEECGLHIHVGQGNNWLPLQSLRKVAAFLYVADPILAQCHPQHRTDNTWCPSLRLYSSVSVGLKRSHLVDTPSQLDDDEDVPIISGIETKKRGFLNSILSLFQKAKDKNVGVRDDFPPRPSIPSYVPRKTTLASAFHWVLQEFEIIVDPEQYTPVPMIEAVNELLQVQNRRTISSLLKTPYRSAYSFSNLSGINPYEKRTIEFRQPAATIEPVEVVSHARIAVRLCEFAANCTQQDIEKLTLDLSMAEHDPGWFDVYDLFGCLGLRPEARVIQASLARKMTQSVRDRYFEERPAKK